MSKCKFKKSNTTMQDYNPIKNKTILVTGSTSGIGKATVNELVLHCSILILPLRNMEKGKMLKQELQKLNPNCQINLYKCDFESIESAKSCVNLIKIDYKIIDIIINNAGILDYQCSFTNDGLEKHFEVNVLSQYIFNTTLLEQVKASQQGRIINVSGVSHKLGKFNLEHIQNKNHIKPNIINAYKLIFDSCLYRNMLTFKLAKQLKNTKVTVNCLHPGAISTNIGNDGAGLFGKILNSTFNVFAQTPEQGSKTTLFLALSKEAGEINGKFWSNSKVAPPSNLSMNQELADILAGKCKELTGI
jgi:NAD(P)-dependent dehydrogenase (short-subunit alcohol dehydrogenase family)